MNIMKNLLPVLFLFLWTALPPGANAKTKSADRSLLDSNGYVLLHPYFNGKNWKTTYDNLDIKLPDTFLAGHPLTPQSFDIGTCIDQTIAVFTTAQGDLFFLRAVYTPLFGACPPREIDFNPLPPQKIPVPGISMTGGTPIYLIKDSLCGSDSMRLVMGPSSPFLLALIVKLSTVSIVRIDTLQMQNPAAVVGIAGEYSLSEQRDTCLWALGANGMIRSFSVGRETWGQERKWDIAGSSDTVKCLSGIYAGTSAGRIYRKDASQTFVLEKEVAGTAIQTLISQGAIDADGNFIEHIGSTWRTFPLGMMNCRYANFIRTPAGFGVEALDSKWKYESHIYRDTASKIGAISPPDRFSYVNNGTYVYPLLSSDTGMTLYLNDPDSNFKDLEMSLKRKGVSQPINLANDSVHTLGSSTFMEICHAGIVRLADGVLYFRLYPKSITIKSNAEIGVQNIDCGTCYLKKYNFTVKQEWRFGDSITIKAGKDILKIANNADTTPVVMNLHTLSDKTVRCELWCSALGGHAVLHAGPPNLKRLSVFDITGKRICSFTGPMQSSVAIPHSFPSGVVFLQLVFQDGSSRRMVLPVVR